MSLMKVEMLWHLITRNAWEYPKEDALKMLKGIGFEIILSAPCQPDNEQVEMIGGKGKG